MLVAKNQEINLGNLTFGKPHSFIFELTNKSSSDITVHKIILGCNACTKASMSKNIIKPNETVNLDVIFTPGSTGNNIKNIEIKYNITHSLKLKFKSVVNK